MVEPYLGQISLFGANFPPRNWAECYGQSIGINENPALFSLFDVMYGGDGRVTFAYPDFRGRTPVGRGHGPGLTEYPQGTKFGLEKDEISEAQLPVHNHTAKFTPIGSPSAPDLIARAEATMDVAYDGTPTNSVTNFNSDSYFLGKDVKSGLQDVGMYTSDATTFKNIKGIYVDVNVISDPSGTWGITGGTVAVDDAGGSIPFSVMQPSIVSNFVVSTSGTYPPRN